MRAGAEMFLDACAEPEVQQIVLLDGPSVLGWDRWREIAAEHGLGLIEASLQAAIEAGEIAAQPVRPLAHVLMGALDEAAMLVARAEDPERCGPRSAARSTRCSRAQRRSPGRLAALGDAGAAVDSSPSSWAARRDSFCAYMRTSASCIAAERRRRPRPGSSPRPRRRRRSTPVLARGQRFGGALGDRVEALLRRRSSSTQNSSPPIR